MKRVPHSLARGAAHSWPRVMERGEEKIAREQREPVVVASSEERNREGASMAGINF